MGDFQAAFVGTAFSLRLLNENTLVQQFLQFFRSRAANRLEFLMLKRVVSFEELDFVKQARPEVVESFDMSVGVCMRGGCEKAIVPNPVFARLPLLRLNDANELDSQHASTAICRNVTLRSRAVCIARSLGNRNGRAQPLP